MKTKPWHLYLLECRGGSFYAGITNDLAARLRAHQTGRGARYTRSHPPVRLLCSKVYPDRSSASRAEWAVKQLPKSKKVAFLQTEDPNNHQEQTGFAPVALDEVLLRVR